MLLRLPRIATMKTHGVLVQVLSCVRRRLNTSAVRLQLYDSILDTIGRTPCVKANTVLPKGARDRGVQLYAKLEYFNPLGSVKDRLAYALIAGAEKSGKLKPGTTVVESTSGNTGIGLAFVCAKKGYPFVAVMSESYSVERRKIMRALGAKVVLTPASASGTGMIEKARELRNSHGWFWAQQMENETNAEYHANTTGPEILRDFAHERLDYWVTGYGTGGTFSGAGTVIKAARPSVKIVLCEPENAPLVTSSLPQARNADETPSEPHPAFSAHTIQGWTPNFLPHVLQQGIDAGLIDQVHCVPQQEAHAAATNLAVKEGIFGGISGGGAIAASCKIAQDAPNDSVILAMIPDTQERYLSAALLEGIKDEMDQAELRIFNSTPLFRSG